MESEEQASSRLSACKVTGEGDRCEASLICGVTAPVLIAILFRTPANKMVRFGIFQAVRSRAQTTPKAHALPFALICRQ